MMYKIYILVFTMALAFVASPAYAANLTVVFEQNPLFGEVNFLPGDTKEGDVEVNNGTGTGQSVYAESVNGSDPDELGSQLYLKVFENANPLAVYENEFDDFLSAGPVSLSSLGAGATTIYTFKVSFIDSADNDYQGKSLGFDLCIGFSGGNFQCGNTEVGEENPVIENPGGGGGGGSGGFSSLVIFNEFVSSVIVGNGTAVIEWDTNLLATSQVIYGPMSGGPYTLDLATSSPNLGYPFGTPENGTKVIHHSMTLTELVAGETYVYRVVSRASPPTVSVEHTFTMPTTGTIGTTGAGNFGIALAGPTGSQNNTGDSSAGEEGAIDTETASSSEEGAVDNNNLLAFALGGLDFGLSGLICVVVAILIFLVILGLLWLISKDKKDKSLVRDVALVVSSGLVVSVILWLIPYTCPIIPFWIIVLIYIIWKLVTKKCYT